MKKYINIKLEEIVYLYFRSVGFRIDCYVVGYIIIE